jgi:hypothetical protein
VAADSLRNLMECVAEHCQCIGCPRGRYPNPHTIGTGLGTTVRRFTVEQPGRKDPPGGAKRLQHGVESMGACAASTGGEDRRTVVQHGSMVPHVAGVHRWAAHPLTSARALVLCWCSCPDRT